MNRSSTAKPIDTEGQVVFDPDILKPPFANDPRDIGYCNVMYEFHDRLVWCHLKVRLDVESDTVWVTPYNPEIQKHRITSFSGRNMTPYFLKKVVVTKEIWKAWKEGHKAWEHSRPKSKLMQDEQESGSDQNNDESDHEELAGILANLLPNPASASFDSNANSDALTNEVRSSSTEAATISDPGRLALDRRVLLFNWPPVQSIKEHKARLVANSSPESVLCGPRTLPEELEYISGTGEHAAARDSLVNMLIETEYLEGRTSDVGNGIQMCELKFTEQLARIHKLRTAVRSNLFGREAYADAMLEEMVNEIARTEVNAARGNDELRRFQLEVRKQFLRNIREFSVEGIKDQSYDHGEVRSGPLEGYAFYVISPEPEILSHLLDIVD